MKRLSLYFVIFAVASLGLWFFASAYQTSAANGLPALLDSAPAGATMIAYADLAALRQSPWIQQLESIAKPAQVDRDYLAFVDATGFDYQRDLDRIVISNHGTPADGILVFAEGRFDHKKIEQYALESGKLQQENGRAVYVVPSTTPGKVVRFTFLAPDRIALSSGSGFSSLISAGAAPALDPGMRERLSRVSGAPIFATVKASMFTGGPGVGVAAPGGAGPAGDVKTGVLSQLQTLRWIALALQPQATDILFSAEGECDRPEDAQRVAGTLELLRAIFRGALADPKSRGKMPNEQAAAVAKLLDAAKITTETVRVRLLVSLTPEMLPSRPLTPPAAQQLLK